MAIREDLVQSAVTFLQDPTVGNAPLDKRVAFLQSKNLTQEEIDAALARASDPSYVPNTQVANTSQQNTLRQGGYTQPPQGYGYGGYNGYGGAYPPGFWGPPPVPKRDWRDYFIMATVMSGLSYGAYFLAKRYVVPLIAPPTPPQLEQDKAAIDESFAKAFAQIDLLASDTAAIKASEEQRKEKLDSALKEIETIIDEMKTSSRQRDEDSKRLNEELKAVQKLVPQAIAKAEETTESRIKELMVELKGLKTLMASRLSGQGVAQTGVQRVAGGESSAPPTQPEAPSTSSTAAAQPAASTATQQSNTTSPLARYGNRSGIPAWQMAAAAKKEEEEKEADPASSLVS